MKNIKIKMHSPYTHLKNYWVDENYTGKYISFYNDAFVRGKLEEDPIALLIEPRDIQPKVYNFMDENHDKFKYIFTHDSKLLEFPNARPIIWGGVWAWSDITKDFKRPISIVASEKELAPTRIERKQLAFELKGTIDTYGTFDGGPRADTFTVYGKYPFSIVIENYIDDLWITEKICNCFSNNCIPIYYGAKNIDQFFNPDGIYICHSIMEIKSMVSYLLRGNNARNEYNKRLNAIKENRKLVKNYENFETWFMNEYRDLLEDLM